MDTNQTPGAERREALGNERAPVSSFRAGYVAVVGLPNAGKSTLVNRLVGVPVSIVAPRPQTTRHRILGILNGEGHQALFLDTPGMLKPTYKLQELMEQEVEKALKDADLVLLVIDVFAPELPVIRRRRSGPMLVVLNKIDRVGKARLAAAVERVKAAGPDRVFAVSALVGTGVEELKQALIAALPEGQPFYPQDEVSERPERFFVAEFIREAVFNRYGAEIPYSTTVVVSEFAEREGRKDYIRAVIYVERQTQKAIIIGRDGAALKKVGSAARQRIERFLGRPVYLELWVKVAEQWRKNEQFIRENVYG